MYKKEVEAVSVGEVIKAILGEVGHQRAHVFVLYTDAHRKLAKRHPSFEHAMTQSDRLFCGDELTNAKFVGQKELLDSLAGALKDAPAKVVVLAGPVKDARDLAKKMEQMHVGLTGLVAVDLPPNYDQNETITGHVIESINKVGAEIILMSSMLLNQEIWVSKYRHRINCSVILGLR
jgi:UDP-N-acetyl-D-mannosaminuronic acid transferase (WecB/TagA/CpsF family)